VAQFTLQFRLGCSSDVRVIDVQLERLLPPHLHVSGRVLSALACYGATVLRCYSADPYWHDRYPYWHDRYVFPVGSCRH
jgi:hypothetical protein